MTKKLMLIGIKPYVTKSGDERYKYLFLDEAGKALTGFSDYKQFEDQVYDAEVYDPGHARAWQVERDVYDGKLSLRVVIA